VQTTPRAQSLPITVVTTILCAFAGLVAGFFFEALCIGAGWYGGSTEFHLMQGLGFVIASVLGFVWTLVAEGAHRAQILSLASFAGLPGGLLWAGIAFTSRESFATKLLSIEMSASSLAVPLLMLAGRATALWALKKKL
jgi:hypothetical protein